MKGFPNQIADLEKIAAAVKALAALLNEKKDVKDDGVFGEALVRAGVAGTGHTPRPIEDYLREQRQKKPSYQSFRTTARGIRELFRHMGLIEESDSVVSLTSLGREAVAVADSDDEQIKTEFWRKVVKGIVLDRDTAYASHPYQMLLRLVRRKPGITRAKCALALEARNDSSEELERIAALADIKDEEDIRTSIGVTKPNWDNAKKVLPKFAEQLGDVVRRGQKFFIAETPGGGETIEVPSGGGPCVEGEGETSNSKRQGAVRGPRRAAREVTADTIAAAGTADTYDEIVIPNDIDPAAAAAAIKQRFERLRRHNLLVKTLAKRLSEHGARIYENPFDILAVFQDLAVLVEVKSLDGSAEDERSQVMDALAQLLYYEAFVTKALVGDVAVQKVACFELPIADAHQKWLNEASIASIFLSGTGDAVFAGDQLAKSVLDSYLREL